MRCQSFLEPLFHSALSLSCRDHRRSDRYASIVAGINGKERCPVCLDKFVINGPQALASAPTSFPARGKPGEDTGFVHHSWYPASTGLSALHLLSHRTRLGVVVVEAMDRNTHCPYPPSAMRSTRTSGRPMSQNDSLLARFFLRSLSEVGSSALEQGNAGPVCLLDVLRSPGSNWKAANASILGLGTSRASFMASSTRRFSRGACSARMRPCDSKRSIGGPPLPAVAVSPSLGRPRHQHNQRTRSAQEAKRMLSTLSANPYAEVHRATTLPKSLAERAMDMSAGEVSRSSSTDLTADSIASTVNGPLIRFLLRSTSGWSYRVSVAGGSLLATDFRVICGQSDYTKPLLALH